MAVGWISGWKKCLPKCKLVFKHTYTMFSLATQAIPAAIRLVGHLLAVNPVADRQVVPDTCKDLVLEDKSESTELIYHVWIRVNLPN